MGNAEYMGNIRSALSDKRRNTICRSSCSSCPRWLLLPTPIMPQPMDMDTQSFTAEIPTHLYMLRYASPNSLQQLPLKPLLLKLLSLKHSATKELSPPV